MSLQGPAVLILCVCVCTIHQNVKLMIQSAKQCGLSNEESFTTYHDCIAQVICNPPLPTCYLRTCKECPGFDLLKDSLHTERSSSLPAKTGVLLFRGAASQYKNRKNFVNLCNHENDFGITRLNGTSPQHHMAKGHVME